MAYRCICGIDPGMSGAVAFYFLKEQAINSYDMPKVAKSVDAAALCSLLEIMQPDIAVLEQVASRPGQSAPAMFNFGVGFGVIQGVLSARGIPTHLVSPQRWKRHFRLDSDKEKSRELALRLWPARSDLFSLKKHEGRAEAALIARYGAETIA